MLDSFLTGKKQTPNCTRLVLFLTMMFLARVSSVSAIEVFQIVAWLSVVLYQPAFSSESLTSNISRDGSLAVKFDLFPGNSIDLEGGKVVFESMPKVQGALPAGWHIPLFDSCCFIAPDGDATVLLPCGNFVTPSKEDDSYIEAHRKGTLDGWVYRVTGDQFLLYSNSETFEFENGRIILLGIKFSDSR